MSDDHNDNSVDSDDSLNRSDDFNSGENGSEECRRMCGVPSSHRQFNKERLITQKLKMSRLAVWNEFSRRWIWSSTGR